MRKILFKGKTKSGEWVEGKGIDLNFSDAVILTKEYDSSSGYYMCEWEVIPETVSECSFVPDKNGVMMFEGDIVTGLFLFGLSIKAVVTFQDGAFGLEWYRGNVKTFNAFTSICNVEYEVIGNIHDNPELLKND